jgi:thiol-disulfide isomerase/thioredoxin
MAAQKVNFRRPQTVKELVDILTMTEDAIFVDFMMAGCPGCEQFAPTFHGLAKEAPNNIFMQLDVRNTEAGQKMWAMLGIRTVPHFGAIHRGILIRFGDVGLAGSIVKDLKA